MNYKIKIPDDRHWREEIKCQNACPVHTDARGYISAIREGDYRKAYLIARGPNPFASICGRICGAPCQIDCRRTSFDRPISIRALKRFVSEQFEDEQALTLLSVIEDVRDNAENLECCGRDELTNLNCSHKKDEKKVAIIGSGPAGLSAAHDLAILGFKASVYEMEDIPAGMLAVGVPEYRLPRDVIRAEVEIIRSLGVEIHTGVEIGKDVMLSQLIEEYDAVIISVGARRSRKLNIKGIQAPGVIGGVEFLRDVALGKPVDISRRVIVIGGGNVASDISRTIMRQIWTDISRTVVRRPQNEEVHLCCLESREEMPADDIEIKESLEEGIIFHNRLGPDEIMIDQNGRACGARFKKVLSVFDKDGRFAPEFDESEFTEIEAGTILLAIGQSFDFSFIDSERDGIKLTERGLIELNNDLSTTRPGVFAAGDVAVGARLMIDAIASGKQAARSVYEYLTGTSITFEETVQHFPMRNYSRKAGFEAVTQQMPDVVDAQQRKKSHTMEVELVYNENRANLEAERCFDCGVNTIFDSSRCIMCGGCVDVCPESCLRIAPIDCLSGDEQFDILKNNAQKEGTQGVYAIIKNDERCIRCASCVNRCPAEAITMERFNFRERFNEVGRC